MGTTLILSPKLNIITRESFSKFSQPKVRLYRLTLHLNSNSLKGSSLEKMTKDYLISIKFYIKSLHIRFLMNIIIYFIYDKIPIGIGAPCANSQRKTMSIWPKTPSPKKYSLTTYNLTPASIKKVRGLKRGLCRNYVLIYQINSLNGLLCHQSFLVARSANKNLCCNKHIRHISKIEIFLH